MTSTDRSRAGRVVVKAARAALLLVAACAPDGSDVTVALADVDDHSDSYAVEPWGDVAVEATGMRFLPDGRALVITKGGWYGPGIGQLLLFSPTGTMERVLLELPVCTDAERGLLGIALPPDLAADPGVYVYYTRDMAGCAVSGIGELPPPERAVYNRVSRFELDPRGIDPATEQVLVDELPAHQSAHNAGDLEFLPDGSLLVAVGEAQLARSADRSVLDGKILRLDPRRPSVALADNPFADDGMPAGLIWATGFRNPFRMAVRGDGALVAADVGTDVVEEINVVRRGHDYGFPGVEGPDGAGGGDDPVYSYEHAASCVAVIGGDFAPPDFAPELGPSAFLFHDMGCGGVWALPLDGRAYPQPVKVADVGIALSDLVVGPDGDVYLVPITSAPIQRLVRRDGWSSTQPEPPKVTSGG